MVDPVEDLRKGMPQFEAAMSGLLACPAVPLGSADPPRKAGVYALVHEGKIKYIDCTLRREQLRSHIHAKWHCVPDRAMASALERLLIWAIRPE